MSEQQEKRTGLVKRVLIWLCAAIALLLAVVVIGLPLALQSEGARRYVASEAGSAFGGSVTIEQLGFSWQDGLHVAGITVQSGPMGLEASLRQLNAILRWAALLGGRIDVSFSLAGLRGEMRLATKPEQAPADEEPFRLPPLPVATDVPLPGWLLAQGAIDDVSFTLIRDGKRFALNDLNGSVKVDGPKGSARARFSGDFLGPLSLAATLDDGRFDADLTLPGTHLRAESTRSGLSVRLRADLGKVVGIAEPFLPLEKLEMDGELTAHALAHPVSGGLDVALQSGLRDFRLTMSTLPMPVALFEAAVACKAGVSPDGTVKVTDGSIALPGVQTGFSGMLEQSGTQPWSAVLTGVQLDFPELLRLAGPLVPKGVELDSGSMTVESVRAAGSIAAGPAAAEVAGVRIDATRLAAPGGVVADELSTQVNSVSASFGPLPTFDVLGISADARGLGHPSLGRRVSAAFDADLTGVRLGKTLPEVKRLRIAADMDDGALRLTAAGGLSERFDLEGSVSGDAARLEGLHALPILGGIFSLDWQAAGTTPDPDSLDLSFQPSRMSRIIKEFAFLERLNAALRLDGVTAVDEKLGRCRVDTSRPLTLRLADGLGTIRFDGGAAVQSALLPDTVQADLSFALEGLDRSRWTLRAAMSKFNASLTAEGALEGLFSLAEDVLANRRDPVAALLTHVSGSLDHVLELDGPAEVRGIGVSGTARAHSSVSMQAGRRVGAVADLLFDDCSIRTAAGSVNGLRGDFRFAKAFVMQSEAPGSQAAPGLSRRVLGVGPANRSAAGAGAPESAGEIRFGRVEVTGGPVPLELTDGLAALRLDHRPGLSRFGFDILGGSVRGNAAFGPEDEPRFNINTVFSNVDFARLLDTAPKDDASVDGRLRLSLPVMADAGRILEEVELTALVPRIGAGTLDSLLAAMDPDGADPNIAAQRRMVAMGGPRDISMRIRGGNFSLEGEVEVFGVRLKLPPVRRVSLAALPVRDMVKPLAEVLGAAGRALRLWRSESIRPVPDGPVLVITEDNP